MANRSLIVTGSIPPPANKHNAPLREFNLAAKFEYLDDLFVTIAVLVLQIVQKAAALPHQLQEASPGVMIVLVNSEVIGQTPDPFGK